MRWLILTATLLVANSELLAQGPVAADTTTLQRFLTDTSWRKADHHRDALERMDRFTSALLADDRAIAAECIAFPIVVEYPWKRKLVIRDRSALMRQWSKIFPKQLIAQVRAVDPQEQVDSDLSPFIPVANEMLWFDARGYLVIVRHKKW